MLNDQGLTVTTKVKLPTKFEDEGKIDWKRVNKFLTSLNEEDLETFCIGDQDDMVEIGKRIPLDGAYAHKALNQLFMVIGC